MEKKMVKQFSLAKLMLTLAITLQLSVVFTTKPLHERNNTEQDELENWYNEYQKSGCENENACKELLFEFIDKQYENKHQETYNKAVEDFSKNVIDILPSEQGNPLKLAVDLYQKAPYKGNTLRKFIMNRIKVKPFTWIDTYEISCKDKACRKKIIDLLDSEIKNFESNADKTLPCHLDEKKLKEHRAAIMFRQATENPENAGQYSFTKKYHTNKIYEDKEDQEQIEQRGIGEVLYVQSPHLPIPLREKIENDIAEQQELNNTQD